MGELWGRVRVRNGVWGGVGLSCPPGSEKVAMGSWVAFGLNVGSVGVVAGGPEGTWVWLDIVGDRRVVGRVRIYCQTRPEVTTR